MEVWHIGDGDEGLVFKKSLVRVGFQAGDLLCDLLFGICLKFKVRMSVMGGVICTRPGTRKVVYIFKSVSQQTDTSDPKS